ncbi:MAG: PD-(D/E)XK nuclease family protein [Cyanobacteriota bacterium]|jgi:hypothetical protein
MVTPLLRLSQGHLQLLAQCPPQFQRRYLEPGGALLALTDPEFSARSPNRDWGQKFHQTMQQWELGLPLDRVLDRDPELEQSLRALLQAVPALQRPDPQRRAEHRRLLSLGPALLTVVYDLLICSETGAEILDWKTYPLPQSGAKKILNHWQTKLYLYVLAETSAYRPEDLSMTYWFVKLPRRPESLTLRYSAALHRQVREELEQLLEDLQTWRRGWYENQISLPHRPDCETCPYRRRFFPSTPPSAD